MAKESLEINPAGIRLVKKDKIPLYMQLYNQFRDMILRRRLRPGDRLPASRNLAKELKVSRVIVNQAYEQLILEGYVIGKTGAGTFVADLSPDFLLNALKPATPLQRTTATEQTTEPAAADSARARATATAPARPPTHAPIVPCFEIGTPAQDQFPYKTWHLVAARVLKNLKGQQLGYGEIFGHRALREAIASYLRMARAVHCEAEQIIVVTGSQIGLNLITQSLLQKGDKVWMEDPGYPGARTAFLNAGAELCPIPVRPDGIDIDLAIRTCPDAKMVYITPSHQFPMGYTLSHTKRLQLLHYAKTQDCWILEDDYDSEFRYEGNPLASLQGLDNHKRVIYTGTFSKVLFPGLRLAYIVLPSADMADRLLALKRIADRQSPIMDQLIVTRFMEEGYFLRHIRKMRRLYAERQSILVDLIRSMAGDLLEPIAAPSGMHILCRLPSNIDMPRFRQATIEKGLNISIINDYTLRASLPPTIALGFTAFTKYRMKTGLVQLINCLELAL